MLFDVEPSGVNDTYLRLSRNGGACIVGPAGVWNGLLRLNYAIAGTTGGGEPYMIFRSLDVGFDDGRFYWRGRAGPVVTSAAMVRVLTDRGLVSATEGEHLLHGAGTASGTGEADVTLMLRAALGGADFAAVYGPGAPPGGPAPVTAFALRTLGEAGAHILPVRDGLPVLSPEARAALRRQVGGSTG